MNNEKLQTENVNKIVEEWTSLSEKISHAHKERNQPVHQLMIRGIRLYEELLASTIEGEEFKFEDIHQFEVLPLNGVERYHFISNRPEHYVAYIQLNELFIETKKKMARLRIKSKK